MKAEHPNPRPILAAGIIREDDAGRPFLEGLQCNACGEVLVASHRACPKCAAVGSLAPIRLSEQGKLYTYTIVHRSFPGVPTPLISAIVKLDDGGFIKGNLIGVSPDPSAIRFDMPVRVEFERLPSPDGGRDLLRYVFVETALAEPLVDGVVQ